MTNSRQPHDESSLNGNVESASADQDADRMIELLEQDNPDSDQLSSGDRELLRMGAAIKTAAKDDLPPASDQLRERLMERLNSNRLPGKLKPASKAAKGGSNRGRAIPLLAIAGGLLLAIGLIGIWQSSVQPVPEEARKSTDIKQRGGVEAVESVNLAEQGQTDQRAGQASEHTGFTFYTPHSAKKSTVRNEVDSDAENLEVSDPEWSDQGLNLFGDLGSSNNAGNNHSITHAEVGVQPPGPATEVIDVDALVPSKELERAERRITHNLSLVVPNSEVAGDASSALSGQGVYIGGGGGGRGGGGRSIGGQGGLSGEDKNMFSFGTPASEGRPAEFMSGGEIPIEAAQNMHLDFHDRRTADSEQYEPIIENPFTKVAGAKALSTFSIDVDTASYANVRRFLNQGQLPPPAAVRIEELVNYFDYDYPQPDGDDPFAVDMELASCPWNEQHHLLRVALQGKDVHRHERSPSNLVFLLDVSGSMQDGNKLPLLKQGLNMMVQQLSERDSVSIVTYAGNAGVVLEPTAGSSKRQIELAIEKLSAGGSTNGSAGIELAYELAQKKFIRDGSNRVILATDGDLNVGITDDNSLVQLIKSKASEGVFLTVLGFGTGNLKDSKLEKLADNGNGLYAYIDSVREAHRVLIEQMSGSLDTIAKDVKLQVEFNPAEVAAYRLIGYENRKLAARDFADDRKDAGEIGAGHNVTAFYELVLTEQAADAELNGQSLKYQDADEADSDADVATNNHDGELLTLSLRYKQPDASKSRLLEFTLNDEPVSFSSASSEFRFAASVASFGMILRQSQHRGNSSLEWVSETASRSLGSDEGGYRAEFLDLIRRASSAQ